VAYAISYSLAAIALVAGMLFLLACGRQIGVRRLRRDPDGARAGVGAVEGAVFGLHMLAFALVMGASIYVILDIEYPCRGLIRVDAFDQVLEDARAAMK
jgi:hypothetical protein